MVLSHKDGACGLAYDLWSMYLANREILCFTCTVSGVCRETLRPERLPTGIKECCPYTLIQRTMIQRNLNSIRDTLSQSLDVKVLILCNFKDKGRRLEPTPMLQINNPRSLGDTFVF